MVFHVCWNQFVSRFNFQRFVCCLLYLTLTFDIANYAVMAHSAEKKADQKSLRLQESVLVQQSQQVRTLQVHSPQQSSSPILLGNLKRHIATLASDSFQGREAGTRGAQISGAYIVNQLKKTKAKPLSQDKSFFQPFSQRYRNILVTIPGSDPELKEEFVLIGAHYDHVGLGNRSNSRGVIGLIHNGADDNASGVALLLEIIKVFSTSHTVPKRSLIFAFWDAEEKGLLGSKYWVKHPSIPLKQIKLTINLDMVGRLQNQLLTIYGTRTLFGIRRLISEQNRQRKLWIDFHWEIKKDSDHYPFVKQGIPYLMFHTGKHPDYHRPTDDAHKLNYQGLEQIAQLTYQVISQLAVVDNIPSFRSLAFRENQHTRAQLYSPTKKRTLRLGVTWDPRLETQGVIQLTSVTPGSPAAQAGLKRGDRILEFAQQIPQRTLDFRGLVLAANNPVPVVVQRAGQQEPLKLNLTLNGTPLRVGVEWKTDTAEPGSVILTQIKDGSPAAYAGLRKSDRIYAVSGKTFRSSEEFQQLLNNEKSPLKLTIERWGKIQLVSVKLIP